MSFPADWYPDPAGDPTLVRYWDGENWTEHTQPINPTPQAAAAVQAEQAVAPEAEPAPTAEQPAVQAAPAVAAAPVSAAAPVVTGNSIDSVAGIRSDLLSGQYAEIDTNARVVLQNTKLLKVRLGEPVLARQGSMVAFQGQVDFAHEGSGGVGKMLKKATTGEGVPLMRCSGQGEVFLARDADQVHILHLDGSALSVNGKNILAFETTLTWDIQRVQGAGMLTGGLFNTRLSGHGWVAITTRGQPVVLHTNQPTFGDPDAVVAWSADLQTSINKTMKAKAMVGMGSGEAFQVAFQGNGIVIVQPSEGGVGAHSH